MNNSLTHIQPVTLPMSRLRPAIVGLGKVHTKRPSLPVLSCVRLRRDQQGKVELTTTDLDRAVTCRLPDQPGGDALTLLIPLDDLANIVRSCPGGGSIEVLPHDEQSVSLRFELGDQVIEHRCQSLPPEEFPQLPVVEGARCPLPPAMLDAIQAAMACASTDSTRYILNGVCLDVSKPGAHYVVGTDGKHLFAANSFQLPLQESVILPGHKFLAWRGFTQDGIWRLRTGTPPGQSTPLVEISSENWSFVTRGIDGKYPDWRRVIPAAPEYKTTVTIPLEELTSLVRTVRSLPAADQNQSVALETVQGRFHILSRPSPEQPWARLEIRQATASGPDVTVGLNREYILKAMQLGLNRIDIIDPVSPLLFSGDGRRMIIMPLRLHGEEPGPTGDSPAPAAQPPSPHTGDSADDSGPSGSDSDTPPATHTPHHTMEQNTHPTATCQPPKHSPEPGHPVAPVRDNGAPPCSLESAQSQLEKIKFSLRDLAASVTKLADTLRHAGREQRAGERDRNSLRQTLRALQNVRI
jgi:DNA polymerase III sliding clamp (beta) subunit (PCNA family)